MTFLIKILNFLLHPKTRGRIHDASLSSRRELAANPAVPLDGATVTAVVSAFGGAVTDFPTEARTQALAAPGKPVTGSGS